MNTKIFAAITAAALITAPAAVWANGDAPELVTSVTAPAADPYWVSLPLTVRSAEKDGDATYIICDDLSGAETYLKILPDTLLFSPEGEIIELSGITEGTVIKAFLTADTPAPLVLPPVYYPKAVALVGETGTFEINRFTAAAGNSADLVSVDNRLELIIPDDLEITDLADGSVKTKADVTAAEYTDLAVVYTSATKSIPPLAAADKAFIIPSDKKPLNLDAVERILIGADAAPAKYAPVKKDGTVLVALREICEGLGYEVGWDAEEAAASVNSAAVKIGVDSYDGKALGHAPEIIEKDGAGITFVPAEYFIEILDRPAFTDGDKLIIR